MPEGKENKAEQYGELFRVLHGAYTQASDGKGRARHAELNEPFEEQKICEITRRLRGNVAAGALFPAVKKCYESGRLPKDRAIAELQGAINYIAAAIIVMEEQPELKFEPPIYGPSPLAEIFKSITDNISKRMGISPDLLGIPPKAEEDSDRKKRFINLFGPVIGIAQHEDRKRSWPWYGRLQHWLFVSWRCPACKAARAKK
jgi:hypothetical protein